MPTSTSSTPGPASAAAPCRSSGHALRECRQRLVRRGIRPAAYTTSENVADLEALRAALGVRQWNLMAISADGILGMSYVRAHPESIRATIVDSGMSPQMLGVLDYERGTGRDLEAVFAGCAANEAVPASVPGASDGSS